MIDLGPLTGGAPSADAINDLGQVVGTSSVDAGSTATQATLWSVRSDGSVSRTNLGTLGGSLSAACGINNAGLIAGYSLGAGVVGYHAALFQVAADGTVSRTDLGAFPAPNNAQAFGNGINAAGQVPGVNYVTADKAYHAVMFALNGTAPSEITLGTLGGTASNANAINDAGQIVGNSTLVPDSVAGNHSFYPTLWIPNGDGIFTAANLGLGPTATGGDAYGLNNYGQIVGGVSKGTETSSRAALWTVNGSTVTFTDLGTLNRVCDAYAINDAGQIVGGSKINSTVTHGFLYTAAGGLRDINTLVGPNPVATAITTTSTTGRCLNRFGQIVMNGTIGGQSHALLLNPTTPPSSVRGASAETTLLAGIKYQMVPSFSDPVGGSHGTVFSLPGGVTGSGGPAGAYGSNRDVTVGFVANPSAVPLASDTANLTGTAGDTVAVQMTYDPALAASLFGAAGNSRLGWYDGARWVQAVDGNTGGPAFFAGDRAYNTATDLHVGAYGIDTANRVVWAVVNHGGTFGVILDPDLLRRIAATSRQGTVTTLTVDSFTGHTYQLQRANSLTVGDSEFSNVEPPQTGATGTVLSFRHDDGTATQGFYRIKLDP